jgi:hypothetical protein
LRGEIVGIPEAGPMLLAEEEISYSPKKKEKKKSKVAGKRAMYEEIF